MFILFLNLWQLLNRFICDNRILRMWQYFSLLFLNLWQLQKMFSVSENVPVIFYFILHIFKMSQQNIKNIFPPHLITGQMHLQKIRDLKTTASTFYQLLI